MKGLATQRADRLAQAKHRGGGSIKTELENVYLALAWEAGELSEGQVSSILNVDRVAVRLMREGMIAKAMKVAEALALAQEAQD